MPKATTIELTLLHPQKEPLLPAVHWLLEQGVHRFCWDMQTEDLVEYFALDIETCWAANLVEVAKNLKAVKFFDLTLRHPDQKVLRPVADWLLGQGVHTFTWKLDPDEADPGKDAPYCLCARGDGVKALRQIAKILEAAEQAEGARP